MRLKNLARNGVAAALSATLLLPGCTTAQLQKQYTSFDGCFHEQKALGTVAGGIIGGLIGNAVGGGGKKGQAATALGVVMGAVIGHRNAWQSCLTAFPVKSQTTVLNDRASTVAQSGANATQAVTKSLAIQSVSASPLVFGKDLEVNVTYRYVSDNPTARDVKARVFRNLIFRAPDGSQQEVESSTEDTIQQGVSRATFAIPTPSLQDADALKSTTNWAFKFVVEVDGIRQAQIIPLNVPQLGASGAPVMQTAPPIQSSAAAPLAAETIHLKAGTALFRAPNSSAIVLRLPKFQSVTVLQRTVEGKFNWVQVRLENGTEGWFRGARR